MCQKAQIIPKSHNALLQSKHCPLQRLLNTHNASGCLFFFLGNHYRPVCIYMRVHTDCAWARARLKTGSWAQYEEERFYKSSKTNKFNTLSVQSCTQTHTYTHDSVNANTEASFKEISIYCPNKSHTALALASLTSLRHRLNNANAYPSSNS